MNNNISLSSVISPLIKNKSLLKNYSKSKLSKHIDSFLKFDLVNNYLSDSNYKKYEFISSLLSDLNISYSLTGRDKMNIPSEGRLIIVSNHPLGGLDAIVLLQAISEVRKDVKVLANSMLLNIEQLKDLFIPIGVFNKSDMRNISQQIDNCLTQEQVLLIFPAGEVSRLKGTKISDKSWSKTPIKLSKRYHAPILPVHIDKRNSNLFYFMSWIKKDLSTLLLSRELFNKKNSDIRIRVGEMIPSIAFNYYMSNTVQSKLLKKHCYNLKSNKKSIFKTQKNVLHPISPKFIKQELNECEVLLEINTDKRVYNVKNKNSQNIINELSRLRELTFRKVNEGTGNNSDKDNYDKICNHLVLWSDENVEIIGSYRIGNVREIVENHGSGNLYNEELFKIHDSFHIILNNTIELGRSFISEKYWRTNSLDHLWQGLGMYLNSHKYIQYLFGAVSISKNYNEYSKSLIVSYYKKWFMNIESKYITAKQPFIISRINIEKCKTILNGKTYQEDFINLKKELKRYGCTVPVLLRKYVDLCEYGGANFLEFGVDYSFNDSIDCVILIDLNQLKPIFKQRYFKNHTNNNEVEIVRS